MESFAEPNATLRYHDIESTSVHWQLKLESMSLHYDKNENDSTAAYLPSFGEGQDVIVDSGTSFLLMPLAERNAFVDFLYAEQEIFCLNSNIPVCFCSESQYESFPDLAFNIDGENYFIPKESYVIKAGAICQLGIMTHSSIQMWILGLNFFQNYYVVFDQEESRVGFAPSITAHERVG